MFVVGVDCYFYGFTLRAPQKEYLLPNLTLFYELHCPKTNKCKPVE